MTSDVVVLLMLSHGSARNNTGLPGASLRGFTRVKQLAPGGSKTVDFRLTTKDFMVFGPDGPRVLQGDWALKVCHMTVTC